MHRRLRTSSAAAGRETSLFDLVEIDGVVDEPEPVGFDRSEDAAAVECIP
jgi:hypothetical protein